MLLFVIILCFMKTSINIKTGLVKKKLKTAQYCFFLSVGVLDVANGFFCNKQTSFPRSFCITADKAYNKFKIQICRLNSIFLKVTATLTTCSEDS